MIKTISKYAMLVTALLALLLAVVGCSDEKSSPTLPDTHPDEWMVEASPDFHGKVSIENGLLSCQECHGDDYNGGVTGISCIECHGQLGSVCTACHGGLDNTTGAPPYDLDRDSTTTALGVGAHSIHLEGGLLASGFSCTECHLVPMFIIESNHYDRLTPAGRLETDSTAELVWGPLAGNSAIWARSTATCSGTYCHGNFAAGNNENAPVWNQTDQAGCGSCHDSGEHPASLGWKHEFHVASAGLSCNECHANVVNSGSVIIDRDLHVNGVTDTLTATVEVCNVCHGDGEGSCTGCHGGIDNQTGAPPRGLEDETLTSQLAVGAHTSHVTAGSIAEAFTCSECHLTPSSIFADGHLGADSVAELTWGPLAGANAFWDRSSASCAGVYCHGDFGGGQLTNIPEWTGNNQALCGSCHDVGNDPASLGWKHQYHIADAGLSCVDCHASVVDAGLQITGLSLHVNGEIDTLTNNIEICNVCHGSSGGSCILCHGGSDNLTGAPPLGLEDETESNQLAVGAHTTHVTGGAIADAFDCSECHLTPQGVFDPGHLGNDSIAEITWGALAGGGASWDRSTASCSGVYCHGGFSAGNTGNGPLWTGTDQALCGSCHDAGADPATLGWEHEYHVLSAGLSCNECHASVVSASLEITGLQLHVNGQVDTLTNDVEVCNVCHGDQGGSCTACHGGIDNQSGAPPAGLREESESSQLAVGAHTMHLEGSLLSNGFACSECHVVPTSVLELGHLESDSIAELTWGSLAGTSSVWERSSATCSGTYCHGNFGGGAADNAPLWTGPNQALCGSCHDVGATPASLGWAHEFHVSAAGLACSECHANVVSDQLEITNRDLHVNGQADTLTDDVNICDLCHGATGGDCTGCHGGVDNQTGAPPAGLRGETSTSDLAVGAHTAHIGGGTVADGFACDECHVVPEATLDPGHLAADSIAELTWGSLAGAGSSWDRGSTTCSGTYCHGNFAGGDVGNAPQWNAPNQAGCGSCHDIGDNPGSLGWKHEFHVANAGLTCAACHANVVDANLTVTDVTLHVNGIADTLTSDPQLCEACHGDGTGSCTGCHGGLDNLTGAPPTGLEGEDLTSQLAVGAHTAHVTAGQIADEFNCTECHITPQSVLDPGHLGADSIAELTWGNLAGAGSSWDRGSATCSGVYCHGAFAGGASTNTPQWTGTDQGVCGSCHDIGADPATLGWKHEYHVGSAGLSCNECHASVVDDQLSIVGLNLHVNGQADTLINDLDVCNACHGSGTGSCTICHGGTDNQTGAPPVGLEGETLTSQLAVGAHTTHLDGSGTTDGFECSECHVVPLGSFDPGHLGADSTAEITWGNLAGAGSVWDRNAETCSGTYCHGNFGGGNQANVPAWTAADQATCGSCHDIGSNPADLGWKHLYHVAGINLECSACHATVVNDQNGIIDPALHVNGTADTSTANVAVCDACHGDPPAACIACHGGTDNLTGAPPVGLEGETQASQLAVGGHTVHLQGEWLTNGFQCSECHLVPQSLLDASHLGPDSIAEIAWGSLAGATGTWNRITGGCTDTYCHGNFDGGYPSNEPIWTVNTQAHCGSCHDIGISPEDLGGRHKKHVENESLPCSRCHSTVVNSSLTIIGKNLHVNGENDVSFSIGNGTYSNGTCSGLGSECHGSKDW